MNTTGKEKLINKVVEVQKIADKIKSNITAGTIMDKDLQEELLDKLQFELVELKLSIGKSEVDTTSLSEVFLPSHHP